MAFVLGKDAKAYRNTGTYGTPVWDEIPNVSKLKLGLSADKAEGTRRASGFYKQYARTLIDMVPSWNMLFDLADTDFTTLQTAFTAGTEKDMIFLSGSSSTGANQGPRADWGLTKFDRDEDENGILIVSVEACPGLTNVPTWFTGTS